MPSGDQRGEECAPGPAASGRCSPVAASTSQTLGRERHTGGVGERTAQRAEDACKDLAPQRHYSDIDVVHIRPHGSDVIEVELGARQRGDRMNINCLHDDEQRHALFTA